MVTAKMDLIVRNTRLRGQAELHDIGVVRERIEAVQAHLPANAPTEIDAGGKLVTPAFVDVHVHLDKCHLGEVMRPNLSGTLAEAVEITWDFKRHYTVEDIVARAGRAIQDGVRYGATFMRVFVDVGTIGGLRPLEGLLSTRQRFGHLADIQIVAFPQEAIFRDPGAAELMEEAMRSGADVVGGMPWFEHTDEDARRHIDVCFEIAQRHGSPIHMLVDDTDDANSRSLEYLAVKTLRESYQGRVTASHCEAMASYNDVYAAKVIDLVRQAEISIVSNAHVSLALAGRFDREPIRRGITRVKQLLAAGVNVASAQDDVNDPYYPFGKPDQLEVGFVMAHTAHLTLPQELETVFDMVTSNAARAMGLKHYGLAPGDQADLVVIDAKDVHEALRLQPPRLHVIHRGRELARSRLESELLA